MGMLRLRFVGNKQTTTVEPVPRYGVLIERPADHAFLDFSGFRAPTGPGLPARAPANWTPAFSASPGLPLLEMARMGDMAQGQLRGYLGETYWADLDAGKFPDDDYYVYFYGITDGEMQFCVMVPVVSGSDMTLMTRQKLAPAYFSFSGKFTGLPGAAGPVAVNGSANSNNWPPTPPR